MLCVCQTRPQRLLELLLVRKPRAKMTLSMGFQQFWEEGKGSHERWFVLVSVALFSPVFTAVPWQHRGMPCLMRKEVRILSPTQAAGVTLPIQCTVAAFIVRGSLHADEDEGKLCICTPSKHKGMS